MSSCCSCRNSIGSRGLFLIMLAVGGWFVFRPILGTASGPVVEWEEKSAYSHIRVTRERSVRSLWFVRDSGEAILESRVDMEKPQELLLDYTRSMFLSYLFCPEPKKVLLVGLGGGAMVHFLKHHDPKVQVEAVEIDPAIVKIAEKYFGIRSEGSVKIINQDAFKHLQHTQASYDVVYLDAFLKPSADTDASGVPLRLKTLQFYQDVQKKLTNNGLVVFNLHAHEQSTEDLKTMRDAFGQTYVFRLSNFRGYIVMATRDRQRKTITTLRGIAAEVDGRFNAHFSFRELVERLAPE